MGCLAAAREGLRGTPDTPKYWSQHLVDDAMGTVPSLHGVRNRDGKEEDRILPAGSCPPQSPGTAKEERKGRGKGERS